MALFGQLGTAGMGDIACLWRHACAQPVMPKGWDYIVMSHPRTSLHVPCHIYLAVFCSLVP